MASTVNDVEAGLSAVQQTATQLDTDVKALIAKGLVNLDPVVQALSSLNSALQTLDDTVKTTLGS